MPHLEILANGLPEALDRFEKDFDRNSFGKGVDRLRQWRLYDIQYHKESEEFILNEMRRAFGFSDVKTPNRMNIEFKYKKNPIKHSLIKKGIFVFVNLFLRWIGFTLPDISLVPYIPEKINKNQMNLYALGMAEDNAINIKSFKRKEDYV